MLRLLWIQFFTGGFRAVRGQFQFSVRFKWRIPLTVSERFELDFRFVFYWSFQCRSQRQFWMNVNFHWFWEQTRSDYDRTALSTVLSEQFGSSSRMNLIEFHFPPVLGTVSIERRFPLTWRMEWIELKVHLRWMRPGKLSLPSSIWKSIFKNLIFVEIFRCSTGRRRKEGRKEGRNRMKRSLRTSWAIADVRMDETWRISMALFLVYRLGFFRDSPGKKKEEGRNRPLTCDRRSRRGASVASPPQLPLN